MNRQTKAILVNCFQDDYSEVWEVLGECSVDVEAEFPDARTAIDRIRLSQNEDRLFIVHVSQPEQVQQLHWLSENFVGRPIMALVDGDSPSERVFAINRAGATQVVPLPLQPQDLQAALHSLRLRHAAQQPVAARRVVAVAGVTGGCGATTIAINLAYEIAHQFDLSVILTEFTSQGMIATCLDVEARHTTHDLLCDINSVDRQAVTRSLCKITERFQILPGPLDGGGAPAPAPSDVLRLMELLKQLADVVILDLPMTHAQYPEAFAATDQVLLVAEQAVPSLRALGRARERLAQAEGLRQTLLINRYDPNKEGFGVTHLQRLLQTPQLVTIANDYHAVSASHNEGRPLRRQAPHSRVVGDISRLAAMLISPGQQAPPAPARKPGRLRRLVHSVFGL
jgi:pilus assembly protein CpaE